MDRLLAISTILAALCLLAPSPPDTSRRWGTVRPIEETIEEFGMNGSITVDDCARAGYIAAGVTCSAVSTLYYVEDAWMVTRISVVVGSSVWTGTEACTVDVDFAGSTTATFSVGADGLDDPGDNTTTTTLIDSSLAAGDKIQVRHEAPVPDTFCENGAACVCGGGGSYGVRIYGVRSR